MDYFGRPAEVRVFEFPKPVTSWTASLDDWPVVLAFYRHFKAQPFGNRIDVVEDELRALFIAAQSHPHLFGFVLSRRADDGRICALSVLKATSNKVSGRGYFPHTFVEGSFVDYPVAGAAGGREHHRAMLAWGRERGHVAIYGYVREGFKLGAIEARYGYKPWNFVIGRPIPPQPGPDERADYRREAGVRNGERRRNDTDPTPANLGGAASSEPCHAVVSESAR